MVLGMHHVAISTPDLDRFVLFSSVAGLWGTGRHAARPARALATASEAGPTGQVQGRGVWAVFG